MCKHQHIRERVGQQPTSHTKGCHHSLQLLVRRGGHSSDLLLVHSSELTRVQAEVRTSGKNCTIGELHQLQFSTKKMLSNQLQETPTKPRVFPHQLGSGITEQLN